MNFAYYESGIFQGEITLGEGSKVSNGKLPFHTLETILRKGNLIDWEKTDVITLPSGYHFKKYEQVTDHIWIYAMPNGKQPIDLIVEKNRIIAFLMHEGVDSSIVVLPGYEKYTPLTLWGDQLTCHKNEIHHLGTYEVEMRDGIKLATEIWLPKDWNSSYRIPTILIRTPYGRMQYGLNKLRYVQRGYAVVSQDVRGREDSQGEWLPMFYEITDGDDTLTWIASQNWSDGNVGMIGSSYGGFVQWAAAASGNPHLKAIISMVTSGSPFGDLPRKNGFFSSGLMAWIFMMSKQRVDRNALQREDWDEILKLRPLKDIPIQALGREIPFWNKWMEHPDYDEFWASFDWTRFGHKINVPALYISGWYDDDGNGTTEAWNMNKIHNRSHQKMILGPWYHNSNAVREIHHVQFGLNAIRYDLDIMSHKWFDRYLKGVSNQIDEQSSVEYYIVGSNEWKSANSWPPETVNDVPFYFHSNGNAQTNSGDGTLNQTLPSEETADRYDFNPENPAPYLIDVSENECSVPENYRDVEKRQDVLVYTSEPLQKDITIAGDIKAVIYASSSARDTDWLVRLTDVDKKGNSIRLSDGMIRARYRHSYKEPELLEPNKIEKYEIQLSKIANCFKKGHRIRVSITSGAQNAVFPNHNTGNNPTTDCEFIIAHQKVFHTSQYPSYINLPVLS